MVVSSIFSCWLAGVLFGVDWRRICLSNSAPVKLLLIKRGARISFEDNSNSAMSGEKTEMSDWGIAFLTSLVVTLYCRASPMYFIETIPATATVLLI